MNYILGLIILSLLAMTGCKEDVSFSQVENTRRNVETPLGPVDPIEPVEPVDPTDPGEPKEKQKPIVQIVEPPVDHMLDKTTQATFKVTKGDYDIEEVNCFVDDQQVECDGGTGEVKLKGHDLGSHILEVVAIDVEGLEGNAKESWNIFTKFKRKQDNLNVKQGPKKTDILFVIDNSSSMRYEQTKISQRFDNFIDKIRGLDWHIGITTTDTQFINEEWADGKLIKFSNRDYFLTPAVGEREAQRLFAKNVKRRDNATDTEKGIKATYRSIERSLSSSHRPENKALQKFVRSDAALAVVVVSDEDESGRGTKSRPENLLKLVENEMGASKVFQFNSIIVHTRECLNGAGHTMGTLYESLSRRTDGIVGDICSDNYSELLQRIGQGVSDLQKVHKLGCLPQDINNDGNPDIEVKATGSVSLPGYTIDKKTLMFDEPLRPGDYQITYFCLME